MSERFGQLFLRVLAVDPSTRGFGYALFEGPDRLVDWGTKDIRKYKPAAALQKIKELIRRYEPEVLVVEDCGHTRSRRNLRVRRLTKQMFAVARRSGIKGYALPLVAVYQQFSKRGARTKYDIASTLAGEFPALMLRLPPKRKPWQSEDSRMSIFAAAALGYTYLARRRRTPTLRSPIAAQLTCDRPA
jgi:RNase H-fold protein (predicted Holliday junction resolvase)